MPQPVWLFDRFRLDTGDASLCRDGQVVNLAPKAFALLCCLAERAGRLVTKDELQDAVWTHHFVSESALKGRMNELRQALGDDPKAPSYIETVARRGYRFIAEVSREDAHPVTAAAGPTAGGALASIRWDTPDALPGVGREAPLAHLQRLWGKAVAGRRQLAFVTGEAGIGKSTLIEMFMQTGQDKPAVLWGQCIEHFGAGEALLPLLGALARQGPSLISVLRARAPAWLVQMPGLLSAEQRLDLQREVLGATQEGMLREGCEILETLSAETPLIVVLEDLHWSDYATLDLLAALGRRPEPAALLVIGSYRPSDVALRDHPMRRVQQELQAHKLCAEVALDSFSSAELHAYLGRRFPEGRFPEAIAEILHRRTGGHPLFLVNLLDYLLAEGRLKQSGGWWSVAGGGDGLERGVPDDIRQMIEQQVARLSPGEQQLLGVASAAGMDSTAALLAAVLREDPKPAVKPWRGADRCWRRMGWRSGRTERWRETMSSVMRCMQKCCTSACPRPIGSRCTGAWASGWNSPTQSGREKSPPNLHVTSRTGGTSSRPCVICGLRPDRRRRALPTARPWSISAAP